MNKHSNVFEERKEKLLKEEEELRKALESESVEAEKSIVTFLKWMGISTGIVLLFYGISSLFKKKKKEKSIGKKKKSENRPEKSAFFKQMGERISDQMATVLTSYLSEYLTRFRENIKTKSKD